MQVQMKLWKLKAGLQFFFSSSPTVSAIITKVADGLVKSIYECKCVSIRVYVLRGVHECVSMLVHADMLICMLMLS